MESLGSKRRQFSQTSHIDGNNKISYTNITILIHARKSRYSADNITLNLYTTAEYNTSAEMLTTYISDRERNEVRF